MTITLITQETYNQLLLICSNYPKLTLQNEGWPVRGYEYINPYDLTDEEKAKVREINGILKKAIKGFERFYNFRLSKDTHELQIRFEYDWNADNPGELPFTGVGYLYLDELLKGFRKYREAESLS